MINSPIDIKHLKEITTAVSGDMIPIYIASQDQNRRISVANLGTGGGGTGTSGFSGFSGASATGIGVDTDWVKVSPVNITGSISNPTKGITTYDELFWRRIGDSMEIRFTYEQSTAGTSGNGAYLFTVPNSNIIDITKIEASSGNQLRGFCGSCVVTDFSTFTHDGIVVAADTTHFAFFIPNIGLVGSNTDNLNQTSIRYYAFLTLPILTWSVGGGTSGFSGFSGTNGSTGTSGFSGFSGTNGSTGTSGFSGTNGSTGTSGLVASAVQMEVLVLQDLVASAVQMEVLVLQDLVDLAVQTEVLVLQDLVALAV